MLLGQTPSKGVPCWWCKDCHRKFVDNDALPGMRTPITQVSSALSMYYSGMSIDDIRIHSAQEQKTTPSDSTVYEWVTKFSLIAREKTNNYQPVVGDTWVADETEINVGGKKVWFWDLIDTKTRFLLATHMSYQRTTQDAKTLFEEAKRKAVKSPKVIITDKLNAYLDGVELAYGSETKHRQSKGFELTPNTNIIERFHGTLKSRTKIMRALKTSETARVILDGWLAYYNFFRPHEFLDGITPAIKANIDSEYKNWLDIVRKSGEYKIPESKPITYIMGTPGRYNFRKKHYRIGKRKHNVLGDRIIPPSIKTLR